MAETRRLSRLTEDVLAVLDLPDDDLVVALSGGADSAALLYLCVRLGRRVRAVHVHHGWPASDMLAEAAAAVAERLAVALDTVSVTPAVGASPEAQAREARYRALGTAAGRDEWILTAHTSDDQAETVVDHLLRMSGADGLRGIPSRRRPFARPLLAVPRSATREMATLAGLPWQDDPSNEAWDPLRNRVRRHLLPELERYNRRIRSSLATTAELVGADVDHLESQLPSTVQLRDDGAAMAAAILTTSPTAPARRLARRLLSAAGLVHPSPSAVEGTLAVARRQIRSHHPGAGLAVRRSGPLLVVERGRAGGLRRVELQPGEVSFGHWRFDVWLSQRCPEAMPLSPGWMVGDADVVANPIVEPAGGHGEVLELLAGAGWPAEEREDHPVVTSGGTPVWVPGVKRLGLGWVGPATRRYLVVRSRTVRRWQTSRP